MNPSITKRLHPVHVCRRSLFCLLFLLFCSSFVLGADYVLPKLRKPVQIDGILASGEWEQALAISGAAQKLDPRLVNAYLAFDDDHVYIALRTEIPWRGELVASKDPRRNVVLDDSFEFWFMPPAEQRVLESGKFGYFQLIVNSEGRLFTCHHDPGYGLPTRDWKLALRQAHRCEDGFWTAELAFPATDFGIEKLRDGEWRILLVRNFRSKPGFQAPLTDVNGFMNHTSYSRFNFSSTASAVQALYVDDAARRLPALFQVLNNADQAQTFSLQAALQHGGQKQDFSRQLSLPPAGMGSFDLSDDFPTAECHFDISVKDGSGAVLWQRQGLYRPPPERIWFNKESYARLEQSFSQPFPAIDFCPQENAELIASDADKLSQTPGRKQGKTAMLLQDSSLTFKQVKMAVPGALSIWVKPNSKAGKTYRRYFSSHFVSSGYIFCQAQGDLLYLGTHHFKGHENKNLLIKHIPPTGEWTHLLLNLLPGRFELWVNGIKRGELEHGIDIDADKLGDLVLGNSSIRDFAVADLAVYERPLDDAEIRSLAQGEQKISGDVFWYQSLNAIVLDLTANLSADQNTERFRLEIRNAAGNTLRQFNLSFKEGYDSAENNVLLRRIHQKIKLEEKLPDGNYTFALLEQGSDNALIEKVFAVKHYEWLGNTLGLSRRLLPPYTALKRQNQTVSCLLRDYALADNGLPAQINAMQADLLAAPIRLVVTSNGKAEDCRCPGLQFKQEDEINIAYSAEMIFPSLQVELQGEFEFDGLLKLDFFCKPGAKSLPEHVYLEVPLCAEYAKLFHACGEHLRNNPGSLIPTEPGTVFKSRSIQQINISNFIPYFWFGDDYRGIAYGADWDLGWVHSDKRDAVELIRNADGSATLRLNLLNDPKKLLEDKPLTIALMASPLKPQPQGWRGWSDNFTNKATRLTRCLYSNPYWGCYYGWTGRYPAGEDFGYIEKLTQTMQTGIIDQDYITSWVERIMASRPEDAPDAHRRGKKFVQNHTVHAFNICKGLFPFKDIAIVYPYTCNITGAENLPEFPVFRDEWANSVHVYKSYSDYAVYYLNKMLDAGFGGIYNDNVFLAGKQHWATGNGYIDEKGNLRPSFGLWRIRNYHKRQRTLMVERGMQPWITAHHTNTNNLIVLSFIDNTMGMEWKYGSHDFQERFTPDYIRAVCQGKQGGVFPTVLDGITGGKTPEEKTWATRTMLASLLPHEVKPTCPRGSDSALVRKTLDYFFDFGTHLPDCRYYAYWAEDNPVRLQNTAVLSAAYRRGKQVLLFLGSFAEQDLNEKISFAFQGEENAQIVSAIDLESGAAIPINGNSISLPLKKHDFAIMQIEFR